MVAFPPCKINLGLRVLRRRPDAYHDIETCFYPVPWTDVLEIVPSAEFSFTSTGLPVAGDRLENLCVRAYRTLERYYVVPPVSIHLHKCIPAGAGLGGGSSDAAHTIRLLSEVAALQLQQKTMALKAAELGSDCAFFAQDFPMIGVGKGDILSPAQVDLSGTFLVIVKPDFAISTSEAYALVNPRESTPSVKEIVEYQPLGSWREMLINDFEAPIFQKYPLLQDIKQKLYDHGAVYASMSGSGAALYGIFDKPTIVPSDGNELQWSCLL